MHHRALKTAVVNIQQAEKAITSELDGGPVSPELVCNPAAIHLQAAAAGIDQARTAVDVAHRLAGRLHLQPQ